MTQATIGAATKAGNTVFSTVPLHVAPECMLVAWSRRSTAANPVEQANRYRAICIERAAVTLAGDAAQSRFHAMLQDAILRNADALFQAWAADNLMASEYTGAPITIDNVLAFWAERRQSSTIDGAAITAWLPTSKTWQSLNEGQRRKWLELVPKMAAPSYRATFDKQMAAAIMARLDDADTEHAACILIATRCNAIINTESQADAL